jgi:RNA polymerase sigma factor (sigma-70 family)
MAKVWEGVVEEDGPIAVPETAVTFDHWYASRLSELVRLAALMVGSREVAFDLVQDAMVGVLKHWDRIDDVERYSRRAVANACRSHHRRVAVVRRHPPPPDDPVELGANELNDALSKLSVRQRHAVVLRYWADLPEAEIAEILGLRRGSVASLLHRALAELRKVIER